MQSEGFLAMVKAQLQVGRLKEAHAFLGGGEGYFIYEGTEEQLYEDIALWDPFVLFEVQRTIPLQRAAELGLMALKKRAGKA